MDGVSTVDPARFEDLARDFREHRREARREHEQLEAKVETLREEFSSGLDAVEKRLGAKVDQVGAGVKDGRITPRDILIYLGGPTALLVIGKLAQDLLT